MKILFDTNVLLDVLLAREPFADAADRLVSLADRGKIQGVLCATTFTTLYYLAAKAVGQRKARKHLRELLAIFEIAPVNDSVLVSAFDLQIPDFEDAVLHEAGRLAGAEAIVTRNEKDFAKATLPVFSPSELLATARAGNS